MNDNSHIVPIRGYVYNREKDFLPVSKRPIYHSRLHPCWHVIVWRPVPVVYVVVSADSTQGMHFPIFSETAGCLSESKSSHQWTLLPFAE